ncbi:MAG: flagellar basal-body rod protein FlgG [Rickettsiales bacterium]|nr:flagellar basal-body rod protein FlgG [Pseudomonadota bacterium]MDA0965495.1 flagellar basal-body rod protein FlgG [Pseudomonadota bacterium]MDG4542819.1 flagellar basal-body rod protein FlgG [Rickettsiales bacterium]MDG4544733.1 flagellar basal-body rod protein FlgG [Rickettsiales bacterium]MDG4546855.1 flagellar basal-body rod protein FlgG [Rickettsiales bacterium]
MQSLHTAATGMQAATTNIDVIANNLANQNTTAYKRKRAEFQDLLYVHDKRVGTQTSDAGTIRPTGIQIGLGVSTAAVYSIAEQGAFEQTSNPFDLAINGKGYFRVSLPDGTEAYTRAGAFQVNGDGEIVTADGYTVSPGITIPDNSSSVTVNNSGEVIVTIAGQTAPSNLGQFELVRFINEAGLESVGQNLMVETEASGPPTDGTPNEDGFGAITQGWLEGSNVIPVTELTNMIKAQRAFEMNIKVMEATDESMQTLNQAA